MSKPIIVGCVIIFVGTILGAISPLFQSKAERAASSRKIQEREKRRGHVIRFWVCLCLACALNALGVWLTIFGAEEGADKRSAAAIKLLKDQREEAARLLNQEKEERARSDIKTQEKIQSVLIALDAAKQEDSKKITEEKIRVLQDDFQQWADTFVKNFSGMKTEREKASAQATLDRTKKEVELSSQVLPMLSFALRFVQESIRAYATKTGQVIEIETNEWPKNLTQNPLQCSIKFRGGATWNIHASTDMGDGRLWIDFMDSSAGGREMLMIRVWPNSGQLYIIYASSQPPLSGVKIDGQPRDLSQYESEIRKTFQPVIESQLLRIF